MKTTNVATAFALARCMTRVMLASVNTRPSLRSYARWIGRFQTDTLQKWEQGNGPTCRPLQQRGASWKHLKLFLPQKTLIRENLWTSTRIINMKALRKHASVIYFVLDILPSTSSQDWNENRSGEVTIGGNHDKSNVTCDAPVIMLFMKPWCPCASITV